MIFYVIDCFNLYLYLWLTVTSMLTPVVAPMLMPMLMSAGNRADNPADNRAIYQLEQQELPLMVYQQMMFAVKG